MTRPVKAFVILGFAIIAALAVVYGLRRYETYERARDWEPVNKAAIRLRSALTRQENAALQPYIVDLDASLTQYVRGRKGRENEPRVIAMRRAIESAECATSALPNIIWDGEPDFSDIERREHLPVTPKCAESKGKLFLEGTAELVGCSLDVMMRLDHPDTNYPIPPRDWDALRAKCASAAAERVKRR